MDDVTDETAGDGPVMIFRESDRRLADAIREAGDAAVARAFDNVLEYLL